LEAKQTSSMISHVYLHIISQDKSWQPGGMKTPPGDQGRKPFSTPMEYGLPFSA